jgi:hypothetical protein
VLLALKVGCPSSVVGCVIALVFILMCVGLMAAFCGVTFSFLVVCILLFLSRGASRPLVEFPSLEVFLPTLTRGRVCNL